MRHIKLQGMHGVQPAREVQEISVGDVLVWNFGYKSRVIKKTPSKSGKMITCQLQSLETGKISERLLGAKRLVAVQETEELALAQM